MTYQETLDFLFSQLPMYQREGAAAVKKNLDNIKALCDHLDQPYKSYPSIHVAGTNGKGSVTHIVGAVLQHKGLKVGYYTSPHYSDFRERIKINGEYCSEDFVIQFVDQLMPQIKKIKPSFFEITVAMAFQFFKEEKVDIAIIETGLGGRLDSTNIIEPILSVITNIGYDHQQFLGDTLAEIAGEKAGIIKKGIPVIIGEKHEETTAVFVEKAKSLKSELIFAEENYKTLATIRALTHNIFNVYKEKRILWKDLECDLAGRYQAKNINTAIQVFKTLNTKGIFDIKEEEITLAFRKIKKLTAFKGRFHTLSLRPFIICDSAHNYEGIKNVLSELLFNHEPTVYHFVLGFVNDKEIEKVLGLFPKNAKFYFCEPKIPRKMPVEELKEKAESIGVNGLAYPTIGQAVAAARSNMDLKDIVFVGGSTFVVAEVV